jgi:uncharacterized Zn finger protein (UPF0148 family)
MSEFDKEAEREKLREKYERDKEKRKSTQRMSELLLKGATMTNRHCDDCGDPIFRYDGQEFCPTCQQPTQGGESMAGGQDATQTAQTESSDPAPADAVEVELGDDEATDRAKSSRSTDTSTGQTQETTAETRAETSSGNQPETTAEDSPEATAGRPSETMTERVDARSAVGDVGVAGAEAVEHEGNLTMARASLARSVERYARAAEQTDDPRRAKDHLAAAREAAEALAALER